MTTYQEKLDKSLFNYIKAKDNIKILEFGVRQGESTKKFIEICEKNNGHLYSVDINDCSNVSNSKYWTFLKSRDDNFSYIKKYIKKKLDVIYIDSYHEPNHVKNILFYYYRFLKTNGIIFIDDISWLPYVKESYRDNEFNEIINRNTFNKIVEIYSANINNFDLQFSFNDSGTAMLKKLNNKKLLEPKKIHNRVYSFKNILKTLYRPKPAN